MPIEIYVTYKNAGEAKKINSLLLKKRLIACATSFPIKSDYWWQEKRCQATEIATFLITSGKNWPRVKAEIIRLHSYKVPCIKMIKFQANKDYENWIKKIVG